MVGAPRILENGIIIYPHRGSQLPPCLEGYRRKAEQGPDAWVLIPLWKSCEFRRQILQRREDCNCEIFVSVCGHPLANSIELTVSCCESCILCPKN